MSFRQLYNKLMIVAHPDDESIFGGGALISQPGWRVICLTNGSDAVRSKEFKQAMEFAQAGYEIWDYPDEYEGSFDEEQVKNDVEKVLKSGHYERIMTHNLHGEYGHSQHKALSRILHNMRLNNLCVFDTTDDKLPDNILKKKMELLHHYESQMYVIDGLESYISYERIITD
ncbi:GlcNAc-PI de-N-acetylase [Fontibacillus panacisegetis]|uniref:GlcNAc-PI de-N-acetylase n=1 Tax=Fontibacillus panacisegetis TaxID=670482 RepID=A0A1G7JU83_9BACL|nr:PIG-L family deacetylase [Fontibacillus panacisegetis]SDF28520.1 GlcNAc-PI de-N-acetylase [Fontibacillus panacisegetis]